MNSSPVFDDYSRYYDLLYNDKDYAGEVKYIDSLLQEYGISGNELLEFGSGTGKYGRLLAEKGYNVFGIERSQKMVDETRQTEGFICREDDIRSVSLGRTFDAVLALFHVISYQTSNTDLHAVFLRAAEHLEIGGVFLFDIWYTPAVNHLKPKTRVKHVTDNEVEVTRIAEPDVFPNENRVDVNYTLFVRNKRTDTFQTLSETHSMRHFPIPEIDILAEGAGFQRLAVEEFFTGANVDEQTWGVCFVLKKI